MIRLFVALIIPENIKDNIIETLKTVEQFSDHRWESKDKIHLTLKFIGDVKEEILQQIIEDIEFVKNYSSFKCTVTEFGFFFRDRDPKILWCNLETNDTLQSLIDELNLRMSNYGIEVEKRKFKAHLTLLRIKKKVSDQFVKQIKEMKIKLVEFNSNKIALIQSVLKPSGSEYKILKIYELK